MRPLIPPKLRPYAVIPLMLALLFASLVLFAHALLQKPSVQEALVQRLSTHTGYGVRTGRIELSLWRGIGLQVHDLQAVSPDKAQSIHAAGMHLALSARALLSGKIVPVSLRLVRPRIHIHGSAKGTKSTATSPAPWPGLWMPGIRAFSMEKGRIVFGDRPYTLESLSVHVRRQTNDPLPLAITASGAVTWPKISVPFRIRGKGDLLHEKKGTGPFQVRVEAGPVPASRLPWPRDLPFEDGIVEADVTLEKGEGPGLKGSGRITGRDLVFELVQPGQRKTFRLPEAAVLLSGRTEGKQVHFPKLTFTTGDLSSRLNLRIDLRNGENPRVQMRAETGFLPIDSIRRYFPAPLLAPWVESRLFPLLQEGEARLEHLTLNGTLRDLENLGRLEHEDALALSMACRGFVVSGGGIPYPFQNVSAVVRYEEGDLVIADLNGRLNDSLLREGRLEVTDIQHDRPLWDILVDGDFDLETLKAHKRMAFLPPDVLRTLDRIGPVSGRLSCRTWFRYKPEWPFPRTRKGLFALQDCRVLQPELRLPLLIDSAEIQIFEESENRFRASGAWGRSRFEADGTFGGGEQVYPLRSARIASWVDMNETLSALFRGFEPPLAFQKPVTTRLTLVREKDVWSCKGRIDLAGVTLRNDRVSMRPPGREDHVSFDMQLGPGEHLVMRKVRCRFRGSSLELSGGYDLERKDLFTLEINAPGLDLADLGLRFREQGHPSSGVIRGRLKIMASRLSPLSTLVLGRIRGEGITAHLNRLPSPITDGSFLLDFSGRSIRLDACRLCVGASRLEAKGDFEGWDEITGTLDVHGEFLDIGDFLSRDMEIAQGGIPEQVRVRAQVHAEQGRWKDLLFGPLQAGIRVWEGTATLERSRIRLEHGVITSSGHLRSGSSPEIYLSNHLRLTDQPMGLLLQGLGVKDPPLEGALNLEALLTLRGETTKDLLQGLSGNANVTIQEGHILHSNVLVQVLDTLSLKKLFQPKPGDLPENAFYFERIQGDADIEQGVLSSENASMASPIFNAVATGNADLANRQYHFTMGIRPHATLDALVRTIPILGYALTGKDRSFLSYYFDVTGPFGHPDVRYVPFKHLGSGVADVLKRLFLSPVRLYESLSGSSPSARAPDSAEAPGP
mgnify:CR=1 FL=1